MWPRAEAKGGKTLKGGGGRLIVAERGGYSLCMAGDVKNKSDITLYVRLVCHYSGNVQPRAVYACLIVLSIAALKCYFVETCVHVSACVLLAFGARYDETYLCYFFIGR